MKIFILTYADETSGSGITQFFAETRKEADKHHAENKKIEDDPYYSVRQMRIAPGKAGIIQFMNDFCGAA